MPGKNDLITVNTPSFGKQRLRKHFLNMYLREAHAMFCLVLEAAGEEKCSFSWFCKQRPRNVLLVGNTPKDQCQCIVHENFKLKLAALGVKYEQSIWDELLCDTAPNSSCWMGVCDECKHGAKLKMTGCGDEVEYSQWKHVFVESKKGAKKGAKKSAQAKESTDAEKKAANKEMMRILEKKTVTRRVDAIAVEFREAFPDVAMHVNVKRIQASEFQADKGDHGVRRLQIDYAMAYTCEAQDEVQGKIFGRKSVNLFTAALTTWGVTTTYCICTDYQQKDKYCNAVILRHLYSSVFPKVEGLQREVIWSDGPSGEFKNRFSVHLLQELSRVHGIDFSWKFSARGHGKGVVDAVGGNVKSVVRKRVVAKNPLFRPSVQDAASFATVASRYCDRTQVVHISEEEIMEFKNANPFDSTKAVAGISNMHHVDVSEEGAMLWRNSQHKRHGSIPSVIAPLNKPFLDSQPAHPSGVDEPASVESASDESIEFSRDAQAGEGDESCIGA
jgi:hypothetical protein